MLVLSVTIFADSQAGIFVILFISWTQDADTVLLYYMMVIAKLSSIYLLF